MTNVSICEIKAVLVTAHNRFDQSHRIKNVGTLKFEKNNFTHEIEFGITYHEDY